MRKSKVKLFVIIDPTSDHQIALEKALSIAMVTDCEIHAYLCVYEEISEHGEYASIRDMKKYVLARAQKRVDLLMQPCNDNHVYYSTELEKKLDIQPELMILRQGTAVETIEQICAEVDPRLLVIGSIARTGISGKLIGNTAEKLLDVIDTDILTIG